MKNDIKYYNIIMSSKTSLWCQNVR